MTKKNNRIPMLIFAILFGSLIISLIMFCYDSSNTIYITFRNTITTIAVHFVIMIISAPAIKLIFNKNFNYDSFWFKSKKGEASLYVFLKVKSWKNRLPIYNSDDYNLKTHTADEIISNMCHAELVHELIALTSYVSIILGKWILDYDILLITSFIYSCFHIMFALVQRYNRQRLIILKIKLDNRHIKIIK